jgi:demethylspheroidene O-methyltransferase
VALALLQSVRRALVPGGTLVVAEPMAEAAGARPVGAAYFGFYLLAMGGGRPRTAAELAALIGRAGFARTRPIRTRSPLQTGVVVATAV